MTDAKGPRAPDLRTQSDHMEALWNSIFEMEDAVIGLSAAGWLFARLSADDDALAWAASRQIEQAERLKRLYYAAFKNLTALRKQREARP